MAQHLTHRGKEKHWQPPEQPFKLTPRQTEILDLAAGGATNKQIAEKLLISPRTVQVHLSNIFKKIRAPNRLQAILWAAQYLTPERDQKTNRPKPK